MLKVLGLVIVMVVVLVEGLRPQALVQQDTWKTISIVSSHPLLGESKHSNYSIDRRFIMP